MVEWGGGGMDGVVVEKVALTFPLKDGNGGEEVKMRPFGYIPDLWEKVEQLLEQNERYSSHEYTSNLDVITGMDA